MSTQTRPELSKKSKYWIPRHRYFELKHFVMQFPYWETQILSIDSMVKSNLDKDGKLNDIPDPVGKAVEKRTQYANNMAICLHVAKGIDKVLGIYILRAIVSCESYDKIKARLDIPCSRDTYYELYRKFFYVLDQVRG